jgi:hypothetical protein
MSTNDSMKTKPNRVSLADEEGVKQVLVNSILGLWMWSTTSRACSPPGVTATV